MTRTIAALMLASVTTLLGTGCATIQTPCTSCACVAPAGAATAVNYKTADALRETLMDERRAQVFYTSVMAKHGQVRPFSNIVHAEERHAAVVEILMTRHGVAIPSNSPTNLPTVPGTLPECNRLAAQLERDNIAMCDRLLADVTELDIRAAFENLRDASKNNHLPAFERWSANSGPAVTGQSVGYAYGNGRGQGRGRGAGSVCSGVCNGPCVSRPPQRRAGLATSVTSRLRSPAWRRCRPPGASSKRTLTTRSPAFEVRGHSRSSMTRHMICAQSY